MGMSPHLFLSEQLNICRRQRRASHSFAEQEYESRTNAAKVNADLRPGNPSIPMPSNLLAYHLCMHTAMLGSPHHLDKCKRIWIVHFFEPYLRDSLPVKPLCKCLSPGQI